jgi:DNA-binding NarL/FixJ family response regulator
MTEPPSGRLTEALAPSEADAVSVAIGRFSSVVEHGIIGMLSKDRLITIVGERLSGPELEQLVDTTRVVVLLDEATVPTLPSWLRAHRSDLPLVVFAQHPTQVYGRTLLAFGVSCLDWECSASGLLEAIRYAHEGSSIFRARECCVKYDPEADAAILTGREITVLALLSEGKSYEQIALRLGISASTVRAHTTRLRRKLKASSRRELNHLPVIAPHHRAGRNHATHCKVR